MRTYLIIIEQPDGPGDNFSAYVPDLPGCVSVGDTEQEVIDNMADAIELHLQGMMEDGDPFPESTVRAVEVAVREPQVNRPAA